MRDLTALTPLLDRAGVKQQETPTYRFHGHRSPANRKRTPVLASVPSTSAQSVEGGVVKMRLYEPIDSWGGPWGVSALEFLEALDSLDESATNEIELHLNTPGGEVWEALAILNNLRQFDAKVTAVVDGIAASCGSFLAVAADETRMAPNSQLMIHDAWGICIGNAGDMTDTADLLNRVSDNIASIYASKSNTSTEGWRTTMLGEAWYSAQEAVDAGLADSVVGESDDEKDPADSFDLKGIGAKYASRAEAPPPPTSDAAPSSDRPVPNDRQSRHRHTANKHGLPRERQSTAA